QTLYAVNRLGGILAEERPGRGRERRLQDYGRTVLQELAWVDEITGTCFACFDRFGVLATATMLYFSAGCYRRGRGWRGRGGAGVGGRGGRGGWGPATTRDTARWPGGCWGRRSTSRWGTPAGSPPRPMSCSLLTTSAGCSIPAAITCIPSPASDAARGGR